MKSGATLVMTMVGTGGDDGCGVTRTYGTALGVNSGG